MSTDRTPQEVVELLKALSLAPQISTRNGGQTIDIYDPNTQAKATLKRAAAIQSRSSTGTYR